MTRMQLTDFASSTACAFLGSFLFFAERHNSLELQPHEWPATANVSEVVFFCIIYGMCISAPAVLGTEYLFSRRGSAMSFGEILWMCPLSLWLISHIVTATVDEHRPSHSHYAGLIFVGGVFMLALISAAYSGWRLLEDVGRPAKRWTDWAGPLACFLASGGILYVITVHKPG
jgi:hypothetical protein